MLERTGCGRVLVCPELLMLMQRCSRFEGLCGGRVLVRGGESAGGAGHLLGRLGLHAVAHQRCEVYLVRLDLR